MCLQKHNKFTLLFLKYLPIILLYTCIAKIFFLHNLDPEAAKHINVGLNTFLAIGLYAVSYSFKFCNFYRILLGLTLYGYVNYEIYLALDIPHNNLFSNIYFGIYTAVCIVCTLLNINKCKLLSCK